MTPTASLHMGVALSSERHGYGRYGELRATDTVFKTELCRWWANGTCKALEPRHPTKIG